MTWEVSGQDPHGWLELGTRDEWIALYMQRHAAADAYIDLIKEEQALLARFVDQGSQHLSVLAGLIETRPPEKTGDVTTDTEAFADFFLDVCCRAKILNLFCIIWRYAK